jgi:hypothetical protein
MECGHNMITHSTKGGIAPSTNTRPVVAYSEKTRDQRVPSQTNHNAVSMEVQYEDPVNPRGSRDCSYAVYFGLG